VAGKPTRTIHPNTCLPAGRVFPAPSFLESEDLQDPVAWRWEEDSNLRGLFALLVFPPGADPPLADKTRLSLAEAVGFEPTRAIHPNSFQDCPVQPLRHASANLTNRRFYLGPPSRLGGMGSREASCERWSSAAPAAERNCKHETTWCARQDSNL
jgi:hypothetical protein